MIPTIVNIVSTCSLNIDIHMKKTSLILKNVKYNPEKFIAIIKKYRNPKSTVLIFPNGKLVITGVKTESDGEKIAYKTEKSLNKIGYNANVTEFKVRNIVSTLDLKDIIRKKNGSVINLSNLFSTELPEAIFEPELFPSLNCVFNNVKIIVFHTGKVNFTGAKNVLQIMKAFDLFLSHLLKFSIIEI